MSIRATGKSRLYTVILKSTKCIVAIGSGSRTAFLSYEAAKKALSNSLLMSSGTSDLSDFAIVELTTYRSEKTNAPH